MPYDAAEGLLSAYATCDRITHYLIEHLTDDLWQQKAADGKGRTPAAIAAHIHNVRGMWLKAAGGTVPEKLEPASVTREEALAALRESYAALDEVLRKSFAGTGQIKGFKPDVAGFVGYLIAHEAHHRGQIAMLARTLGHPLPKQVQFGMWEWGSRAKEI